MDQEQQARVFYDRVWPHRADLLRVAQFLSRDRTTAEDLAQDTLLKAFRSLDGVDAGSDLKTWLLRILRNTWVDRLRARQSRPAEVSLDQAASEPAADAQRSSAEAESWGDPRAVLEAFSDQQVIDALGALPEEIRWTLLLVDVQGLSVQEAAGVLDVPAGTIKSRAHRGRRMLHEKLLPLARQMKWAPDDASESASPTEES